MQSQPTQCYRVVGEKINCPYCEGSIIKYGKNKSGTQRYRCKDCNKIFLLSYMYAAYQTGMNNAIKDHIKEGCGIRSIARLLKISATTVLKRLLYIAKTIVKPIILIRKRYELDELCTYVGKKANLLWIVYAIRKDDGAVVDFSIGKRTNQTLKLVTDTLLLSNADKVYTDNYGSTAFCCLNGYIAPNNMEQIISNEKT